MGAGSAWRCRASAGLAAVVLVLVGAWGPERAAAQPADVTGHWAEEQVLDLLRRGIISADPEGRFNPDGAIGRGQFVAWLVSARAIPRIRLEARPFTDVPTSHAFAPEIETAAAYGMVVSGGAFRPDSPMLRADGFEALLRTLGHTFESSYMSLAPLPFVDADGLSTVARGAVAVAVRSAPPLLREPPSDRLRPGEVMTRAEAASLVWGYIQAVERGVRFTFVRPLGSGVTLVLEKRGALRSLPAWRVQIGAFAEEDRARQLASSMRARGLAAFVDLLDDLHKVRVGSFATRGEAVELQRRLSGEGFQTALVVTLPDYEVLPGPFWTGAVLIEAPGGARLRPALARGAEMGRGRTSDAARRTGAIAAVNGGFFASGGGPLGCLVIDREVVASPQPGRTCAGIHEDGGVLFDVVRLEAAATADGRSTTIDGVNRARGSDEIILYRPAFGASTRTNNFGAEVILAGDTVLSVVDGRGNNSIPAGGSVLSGHGRGRSALLTAFRPGERVVAAARLGPVSGDPRWSGVRHVIGGGPRLLAAGQFVGGEGFRPSFSDRRHPRTALGVLADGRVLLVTVDGRQPYHSLGMNLLELAMLLLQLGVTDALNLDGGGSTTLVVGGSVVNLPSDEAGERPVSDVLLVLPPESAGRRHPVQ